MFAIVVLGVRGEGAGTIPVDPSLVPFATVLGGLTAVSGLLLILWASAELRRSRAFTAMPKPRGDASLVDSGPYRWIRHPIYTGLVVAGLGAALVQLSVVSLIAAGLLFIVLDLKRRREEAWLAGRYAGYAAYRAGRRALFPFVY